MKRAVLGALVLGALAACEARAQGQDHPAPPGPPPAPEPPPPVAIPAGWGPIAAAGEAGLAAARAANAERRVDVRTWGETGLGCFVTVVEAHGVRVEPLAKIAAALETTLGGLLTVEGWTFVDGPTAEVTARVTRGAMRGAVRGRLAADPTGLPHAAVAACFYNEREPVRCQAACTELLASLEAPRVTP